MHADEKHCRAYIINISYLRIVLKFYNNYKDIPDENPM